MTHILDFLTRGVANIIPSQKALEDVLNSDKKLNIYLGIDPTATRIHLGHAVAIRKLQTLVNLGHHVTFLIGDFTALIGDTSDKDTERPVLTYEQIQKNFETYKSQASKLLDFSKVELKHNSEWLKKLNFEDILKLTRNFTLNDFISRELIKKRLTEGKSVSLPEVLYPVMQGYDSYFLDTDLQIGGTDQTFNMQAGRTLQKNLRNKDSFVLSLQFLEGTDGRKMSKSWGNAIWLDDPASEMFGKVMSLKDELIDQYFHLATNLSSVQITALKSKSNHPMQQKKLLAHQIVSELHSTSEADQALNDFENQFQKKSYDQLDITPHQLSKPTPILDLLVELNLISSKSEGKRLIEQNAIKFDQETITNPQHQITSSGLLKVGPRKIQPLEFKP